MVAEVLKKCKKCNVTWPATSDFFGHTQSGNYRGTCRVCIRANSAQWAKANPDKIRARATKRNKTVASWKPSTELRQLLFTEQNGQCALCGNAMSGWSVADAEVDHLIPASKGGTNNEDNLVIAHHKCNKEKANKTFSEYVLWRAKCHLPVSTFSSSKLVNVRVK